MKKKTKPLKFTLEQIREAMMDSGRWIRATFQDGDRDIDFSYVEWIVNFEDFQKALHRNSVKKGKKK